MGSLFSRLAVVGNGVRAVVGWTNSASGGLAGQPLCRRLVGIWATEYTGEPPTPHLVGREGAVLYTVLLIWMMGPMTFSARASEIRSDESVVFFPTTASFDEQQAVWTARVHGWIFEPEADSLVRNAALIQLRAALGLSSNEKAADVFEQRARWLLVDNERGKDVEIRIGDRTFSLEPSVADGHFFGTLRLEADFVDAVAKEGRLRFAAVTNRGDTRKFDGSVHLIQPQGLSVISDIDDTIKVSEVGNRPQLLKNTFLRPFRAVDGMADVYRRWNRDEVEFHFVSASPWQLYVPLATFAEAERFPSATYHLKRVRFKDKTVLSLFANPVNLKLDMIREILGDFPMRRFILVGDSGERDPEVYGQLARDYPEQIQRIYIRDVTGDREDGERYQSDFAGVPSDMWRVFQDAAMLLGD